MVKNTEAHRLPFTGVLCLVACAAAAHPVEEEIHVQGYRTDLVGEARSASE